jgi:hypothetical protein
MKKSIGYINPTELNEFGDIAISSSSNVFSIIKTPILTTKKVCKDDIKVEILIKELK